MVEVQVREQNRMIDFGDAAILKMITFLGLHSLARKTTVLLLYCFQESSQHQPTPTNPNYPQPTPTIRNHNQTNSSSTPANINQI